ncbi:MAG: dihydrofolate reductase [Robiginitomaculum sp.]|nr:dihydrofolate reductase [Robiginitomaculum sp.]
MSNKVKLSLIVAAAENHVIGLGGDIPWRLGSDLAYFKRVTLGKPVLMGRKTWESLPVKPLPGRPNLVLSRNPGFVAQGAIMFDTLAEMIEHGRLLAANVGEAMIIGGETIYRKALPMCDRVYLTRVQANPDGDTFFPKLDKSEWRLREQQPFMASERDDFAFVTQVFERIAVED